MNFLLVEKNGFLKSGEEKCNEILISGQENCDEFSLTGDGRKNEI